MYWRSSLNLDISYWCLPQSISFIHGFILMCTSSCRIMLLVLEEIVCLKQENTQMYIYCLNLTQMTTNRWCKLVRIYLPIQFSFFFFFLTIINLLSFQAWGSRPKSCFKIFCCCCCCCCFCLFCFVLFCFFFKFYAWKKKFKNIDSYWRWLKGEGCSRPTNERKTKPV